MKTVHAEGKVALELKGYGHFVPMRQKVYLYGERGLSRPPGLKSPCSRDFAYVMTYLFPKGMKMG